MGFIVCHVQVYPNRNYWSTGKSFSRLTYCHDTTLHLLAMASCKILIKENPASFPTSFNKTTQISWGRCKQEAISFPQLKSKTLLRGPWGFTVRGVCHVTVRSSWKASFDMSDAVALPFIFLTSDWRELYFHRRSQHPNPRSMMKESLRQPQWISYSAAPEDSHECMTWQAGPPGTKIGT